MDIFLDAVLAKQITPRTFRGNLANGHEFTAFLRGKLINEPQAPVSGDAVRVAFTPFDMSKGEIKTWETSR